MRRFVSIQGGRRLLVLAVWLALTAHPAAAAPGGDAAIPAYEGGVVFTSDEDRFSVVMPEMPTAVPIGDFAHGYMLLQTPRTYLISIVPHASSETTDTACEQAFDGMRQTAARSGRGTVSASRDALLDGRHAREVDIVVNGSPGIGRCIYDGARQYVLLYASGADDAAEGRRFFGSFAIKP